MRYGMLLIVVALCAAGCMSSMQMQDGTTVYSRSGLGEIPPTEMATAHAIDVNSDAQANYTNARAGTEEAWGQTLREQPQLVLDYLRDVAFPWRGLYGGYGQYSRRPIGGTDPCYYGVCGVDLAPAGGVR